MMGAVIWHGLCLICYPACRACPQDMHVAFSFCHAGNIGPWTECQMGRKLRALLVCEVNKELAVTTEQGLPEKYIVIQAAGQVRVRYVLVYVDDRPPTLPPGWKGQRPRLLDSGTMLILLYGVLLMMIGTVHNMDNLEWLGNMLRSWLR